MWRLLHRWDAIRLEAGVGICLEPALVLRALFPFITGAAGGSAGKDNGGGVEVKGELNLKVGQLFEKEFLIPYLIWGLDLCSCLHFTGCNSLDHECLLKTHVLKTWSPAHDTTGGGAFKR